MATGNAILHTSYVSRRRKKHLSKLTKNLSTFIFYSFAKLPFVEYLLLLPAAHIYHILETIDTVGA